MQRNTNAWRMGLAVTGVVIVAGVILLRKRRRACRHACFPGSGTQQPCSAGSPSSETCFNSKASAAGPSNALSQPVCTTSAPCSSSTPPTPCQQPSAPTDAPPGSCAALQAAYLRMAAGFNAQGFNLDSVAEGAAWFDNLEEGGVLPWPKRVVPGCTRLLVVPLEGSPPLCGLANQVTQTVLQLLPEEFKVYCNARSAYHVTVFHTSRPTEPRPDPFHPQGGLPGSSTPPEQVPLISDSKLGEEQEEVRRLVAAAPPPTIKLERVLMAPSGVLLLTWTDPSGNLARLRQQLHGSFPGAPAQQATIIHSSLLRVLTPKPLPPAVTAAISAECDFWTQQLHGKTFTPSEMWYILEHEYSTIQGDRSIFPVGS